MLGKSQMLRLNASAFVVLTGNGLTVSEDLARRFIMVDLDPRTEDPESREFKSDILRDVGARRAELLAALLTIWRWGRRADEDIQEGRPLGASHHGAGGCAIRCLTLAVEIQSSE